MRTYDSNLGEPRQQKQWGQWITKDRTMGKSERNQTKQTQKIYWIIFDYSHIYSTRRNSKNYQKGTNGITR